MKVKAVKAWAAVWYPEHGPLEHTVRATRTEVAKHMAETWGTWKRAYRRGCRIIPVHITPLEDKPDA